MSEKPVISSKSRSKPRGGWRGLAFANSATRREAKAILFQELAVVIANSMPLDEALEASMRVAGDSRHPKKSGLRKLWDAHNIFYFIVIFLCVFAFFLILLILSHWSPIGLLWMFTRGNDFWNPFGFIWIFLALTGPFLLLLCVSSFITDVERVARVFSGRLLPLVRAGHSLSDAMAMFPQDYAPEEVSIIRAGESWGNVSAALEKLGEFQYVERQFQRHWARMAYPIWLGIIVLMLTSFIIIFIIPKYKDVFDQLGAPLPEITRMMVEFGFVIASLGPVVLLAAFLIALVLSTGRVFMVGNRMFRDILGGVWFVTIFLLLFGLITIISESNFFALGFVGLFVNAVLCGVLSYYITFFTLLSIEKLVLWIERSAGKYFGNIPIIGAPRRTEMESRWLAALALGLGSMIDTPGAVEAAGDVCGGKIAERSRRAADLIRKGYSIGDAVVEAHVLRPPYANRMRLLDDRAGYEAGLREIAQDASLESYHMLNRAGRIAEVLSVCFVGLLAALFAFATYMPMFQIPLIVGAQN